MSGFVLDSEALSQLVQGQGPTRLTAVITAAAVGGVDVFVPAAVLSEQYRSRPRSQGLDAYLNRNAFKIIDTDQNLARVIGRVLSDAQRGSKDHVDATCVAVAIRKGANIIVTTDVGDLRHLIGDRKISTYAI